MKPTFPLTSEARKQLYILQSFPFIKDFLGYGSYGTHENFEKFSKTFFLNFLHACDNMKKELDQHFHHSSASLQIMLAEGLLQIVREGLLEIDKKKINDEIDHHNNKVVEHLKEEVKQNEKNKKVKKEKSTKQKANNKKITSTTFKAISEHEVQASLEGDTPVVSLDIDYINKDYLPTYFNCINTAVNAFAEAIAPYVELYHANKIPTSAPIHIVFPKEELKKEIIESLDLSGLDAEMEKKMKNLPIAERLDKYQVAILFHFLNEQKVIINYPNTTLAKLLHYLTGHSEHNLRAEALGPIHFNMEKEIQGYKGHNLNVVKMLLQDTIDKIDEYIQKKKLND